MDERKNSKHIIDSVFVICLMLLFVLSALSVIAIGAAIYKKNVASMADNNSHRIASAYITEKIRQADIGGQVTTKSIFEKNALVLSRVVNDQSFNTYIYDYDGNLMELDARADLDVFYPLSGQKIMEIGSLDIEEVSDNMLGITITLTDGTEEELYIAVRSTKGN